METGAEKQSPGEEERVETEKESGTFDILLPLTD